MSSKTRRAGVPDRHFCAVYQPRQWRSVLITCQHLQNKIFHASDNSKNQTLSSWWCSTLRLFVVPLRYLLGAAASLGCFISLAQNSSEVIDMYLANCFFGSRRKFIKSALFLSPISLLVHNASSVIPDQELNKHVYNDILNHWKAPKHYM